MTSSNNKDQLTDQEEAEKTAVRAAATAASAPSGEGAAPAGDGAGGSSADGVDPAGEGPVRPEPKHRRPALLNWFTQRAPVSYVAAAAVVAALAAGVYAGASVAQGLDPWAPLGSDVLQTVEPEDSDAKDDAGDAKGKADDSASDDSSASDSSDSQDARGDQGASDVGASDSASGDSKGAESSDTSSSGKASGDGSASDGSGAGSGSGSSSGSNSGGSESSGNAGSSGGSSSGGSSAEPAPAPEPKPAPKPQTITVSVTVDGSAAGGVYTSTSVTLQPGSSVYTALLNAGVSVNASNTQFGTYVSAIGGLAEKEHGSMSGWMYSVNGVTPNKACSAYTLSDGDSVYWYYVNVEY